MRKIIVSEFVTLDGVMQAPGYPDEDRSGGFEHGGWQRPYSEMLPKSKNDFMIQDRPTLPKFTRIKEVEI